MTIIGALFLQYFKIVNVHEVQNDSYFTLFSKHTHTKFYIFKEREQTIQLSFSNGCEKLLILQLVMENYETNSF